MKICTWVIISDLRGYVSAITERFIPKMAKLKIFPFKIYRNSVDFVDPFGIDIGTGISVFGIR